MRSDPGEGGAVVADWVQAGHPLITAASRPGDAGDTLRLGLALPGRQRAGLLIGQDAVAEVLGVAPLANVAGCLPAAFSCSCALVLDLCPDAGAFGSAAWQAMTGLPYLHPASDLDLICPGGGAPMRLADALAALPAGLCLDGEVLLPCGRAAHWRELARRPSALLLKGHGGPWLEPLAQIAGAA